MSQNSYLREFCAQVSQIVFLADLTVLRLITTVWAKISQKSYLLEFCSLKSQIEFLTSLTVLPFIKTVWAKISQNSYLREFCVSQIVLTEWPSTLTVCVTKLISSSVHKWQIVFLLDRFTAYYNCMRSSFKKCHHKTHISASSVHKYHKSCSLLHFTNWPFYGLLELYEQNCHKTHISASSVHKYHNRVPSWFDRFTVLISITTVWAKIWARTSQNSYLREFCAQMSQIVFLADWFDRFTVYYKLYERLKNYHKTHISASSVHKCHKSCS